MRAAAPLRSRARALRLAVAGNPVPSCVGPRSAARRHHRASSAVPPSRDSTAPALAPGLPTPDAGFEHRPASGPRVSAPLSHPSAARAPCATAAVPLSAPPPDYLAPRVAAQMTGDRLQPYQSLWLERRQPPWHRDPVHAP